MKEPMNPDYQDSLYQPSSSLPNNENDTSLLIQDSPKKINNTIDKIKHISTLLEGFVFLKYGRWGSPGFRTVYISSDLQNIEWKHFGKTKPSNFMPLSTLVGIKLGRRTPNFNRYKHATLEQEELSFSLIGENRVLDLEASTKIHKDQFLDGLISLMKWYRKNYPKIKIPDMKI